MIIVIGEGTYEVEKETYLSDGDSFSSLFFFSFVFAFTNICIVRMFKQFFFVVG